DRAGLGPAGDLLGEAGHRTPGWNVSDLTHRLGHQVPWPPRGPLLRDLAHDPISQLLDVHTLPLIAPSAAERGRDHRVNSVLFPEHGGRRSAPLVTPLAERDVLVLALPGLQGGLLSQAQLRWLRRLVPVRGPVPSDELAVSVFDRRSACGERLAQRPVDPRDFSDGLLARPAGLF